jgi:uracil-DNA glycosylase
VSKFSVDVAVKGSDDTKTKVINHHPIFMLWGNYAKNKGAFIDRKKHLVLEAAHPSPFSAYNGFFGCKHFSKANTYLKKHKKNEIAW